MKIKRRPRRPERRWPRNSAPRRWPNRSVRCVHWATWGALQALQARSLPAGDRPCPGGESSPEIHNNLGRIHLSQGALDKAQAEFEQALALAPDNAEALLNMGSIRRAKGRVPEAEHFVKRALRVNPNSIAALGQLAEIKRDLGELDESIRLYHEALAIDDSPPFLGRTSRS